MKCANPDCLREFTPSQTRQVFCCVKCRMHMKWKRQHAAREATLQPIVCPICGTTFIPHKHRRYCSEACSEEANRIHSKERHKRSNAKRAKKPAVERRGRKRMIAPYTAQRMQEMRAQGMTIEAIAGKVHLKYATVQHALANIETYLTPPGMHSGLRYEEYIREMLRMIT